MHGYGGLTLHDIINNRFAHKAIEKGADGLIAVAAGAGGHAGSTSPFALIQDIRAWFDGPLLLSGAIATGRAVLAAQVMGADLAYIGTAFVATPEARAIEDYKQAIVAGDASDIIGSTYFTGVFGNYLKPSIVRSGLDPDSLPERDAKAMSSPPPAVRQKRRRGAKTCPISEETVSAAASASAASEMAKNGTDPNAARAKTGESKSQDWKIGNETSEARPRLAASCEGRCARWGASAVPSRSFLRRPMRVANWASKETVRTGSSAVNHGR